MTEYFEKAGRSIANIIYLWVFVVAVTLLKFPLILSAVIWSCGEFLIFLYYFIKGRREYRK
jgi:hypothetical protein